MAGLVPAIYDFCLLSDQDVDARDERGHDGVNFPVMAMTKIGPTHSDSI